jgi:hypothetical protein
MQEHAGNIAKSLETATYSISIPITLIGLVDIIDHHTWIVGAIGMLLTFIGNMVFKWIEYKSRKKEI